MAQTIFIKFLWVYCTFVPQQYDTIGFPGKSLYLEKFLIFYPSPNVALTPTEHSCSNSIYKVLLQLSPTHRFHFQPTLNIKGTLMLRVVHNKNQETTWVKNMELYKRDQLFLLLCY